MQEGQSTERVLRIRQRTSEERLRAPVAEIDGYRGRDLLWYYVSPYEFAPYWQSVEVRAPTVQGVRVRSAWARAGGTCMLGCREEHVVARLKVLAHFTVPEPEVGDNYYTFPNTKLVRWLRHKSVLIRRERPIVPVYHKHALPKPKRSRAENAKLCNVYMRPWVLDEADATDEIPHTGPLMHTCEDGVANARSFVATDVTHPMFAKRFRHIAKRPESESIKTFGSYEGSSSHYIRGDAVSESSCRLIIFPQSVYGRKR